MEKRMISVGCDPGPEWSAFAVAEWREGEDGRVAAARILRLEYVENWEVTPEFAWGLVSDLYPREEAMGFPLDGTGLKVLIEEVVSYGRVVGRDVFRTCRASGSVEAAFRFSARVPPGFAFDIRFVRSPEWRRALTGYPNADDAQVRQALIDAAGEEFERDVQAYSRKWKKYTGGKKPITSHLRDAAGAALWPAGLMWGGGKDGDGRTDGGR